MTNLEFYKDKIMRCCSICRMARICKYGDDCYGVSCDNCEFSNDSEKCMEIVLAKHKEPIKLKQWEYDLIKTNDMSHDREFMSFNAYRSMKAIGYFEGITDESMTLKEILDNSEIVD